MEQDQPVLDIRELLWKARRYKWLALFPVVLLLCGSWVYLMLTPPVYESYVVVSVDDATPVSAALAPLVRSDRREDSGRERVLRVDSRIHSRSFLETLASRLDYGRSPERLLEASAAARRWRGITAEEYAMRMAVFELGKKIIVMPEGETRTRIGATDRDPRAARKMASLIADQLIEETKQTTIQRASERGEFSADQIAVYEERLRKSESALRAYQESVIGRKLTSNPITDANFEVAKGLISETRDEMEQIRARLSSDLGSWANAGGSAAGPPELQTTKTAELESRLNEAETSYGAAVLEKTSRAGDIEGIKLRIGAARQALFAEYESLALGQPGLTPAARDAAAGIALDRSELRSLRQKERYLTRLTTDYSQRVQDSPKETMELDRLRSEVETNRDLLLALKKEATSSRISAALETSQLGLALEVVESPQLPLTPIYPNPIRVLGIALLVGPLLGVGLIVVTERLGAALHTLEQAEREIGCKVIGTIPRIEGWTQPGSYVQKYWPVLSIVFVLLATAVFYTLHVTVLSPKSATTESVQPTP